MTELPQSQGLPSTHINDGWKSRKFWFCVALVMMSTYLLVIGTIPATIWENVIIAIIMTFVGGNVMEKWVTTDGPNRTMRAVNRNSKPKQDTVLDPEDV